MWQTVKRMVKDCLTENDGKSYCPVRCVGTAFSLPSIAVFLTAGCRMAFQPNFPLHDFALSFSIMMGGIAGGLGLGIAAKALTDNQAQSQN